MSEDPAFLAVGDSKFKEKYDRDTSKHLLDPQNINSYSYAKNNPLKYTDPDGEIVPIIAAAVWAAAEIGLSAYDVYSTVKDLGNSNLSTGQKLGSVGLFVAGTIMPGGGYKTAVDKAGDAIKLTPNQIGKAGEQKLADIVGPGKIHSYHQTDLGVRFIDRETTTVIHEAKNTYISASQKILQQANKDALLHQSLGKQPIWHLFKGGTQNAINALQQRGIKVIDYSRKAK